MKPKAPSWVTKIWTDETPSNYEGVYVKVPDYVKKTLESAARKQGISFQDYMNKKLHQIAETEHKPF